MSSMTECMTDNWYFIAPVATIVEHETKKAVYGELKREDRRRNVFEAGYSIAAKFGSSSNRPWMEIFDD